MAPRGIRNNNPGNIEYGKFARSMGSTGSDGRFAKFSTPEAGIRAIVVLQQRYEKGGRETLFERISRWAPASDNNDVEAYANALARKMGIDINTPFSINDPVLGPAFVDGMIQHENGRQPYTAAQIQSGHGLAATGSAGPAATGSAGPAPTGGIADVAARNPPAEWEPGASTALQGFAPNLPDDPAQAAIDANFGQSGDLTADQIDELTRTDVAGNYVNPLTAPTRSIPLQLPPEWNLATGFPPPLPRRPGPGGALGVDLGMQPAGMPVPPPRPYNGPMPPPRPGTFDWMGGGAPNAGAVPLPGISPLRPAMGGPGDRRPQPPMPPSRASGLPLPPMRPAPDASMANMPSSVGMPPEALQSLVAGRPEFPGQMPTAPFQTPYGGPPPVTGASPGGMPGAHSSFDPLASARMNLPPPLPTWDENASRLQSDALARDLGFNRRQMEGYTLPPPPAASMANMPGIGNAGPPNFASADPSVMLPPSWSPATSFPAADTHRSGEWFTPAPPMSAPVADANAGRFDVFDMPSGNIMDLQTAFNQRSQPPAPTYPSPFGSTPAYADEDMISGGGGTDFLRGDMWTDAFGPSPADAATVISPLPKPTAWGDVSNISARFEDAAGPTQATQETAGRTIWPGGVPPMNIQSQAGIDRSTEAPPPLAQASTATRDPQATQAQAQPRTARGRYAEARPGFGTGFGQRMMQSFIPGGSFLGPNAVFGLGNAGSFTPSGAFGTSPFNQQPNGQMGTTNWRQGSVTGNPQMSGVMWNRSGDNGSVGYVTDPFNPGTSMIYSGSPTRF